ncbi:MAG: hypothetical protein ACFIN2_00555 [Candidatus Walczuchella monophlebidarum]
MPDFDHSQHVVAGEETIKKYKNVDVVCHGEVQDKVKMVNVWGGALIVIGLQK